VACCTPPPQRHTPPLPVAHQPCGHLCCQTQPQTRSNLTNETAAIMEAVVAHQQHGLLRGGVAQVNTRTREAAGNTTLSPAAHSTQHAKAEDMTVVCATRRACVWRLRHRASASGGSASSQAVKPGRSRGLAWLESCSQCWIQQPLSVKLTSSTPATGVSSLADLCAGLDHPCLI
jgi:hypothetical protein